MKAEFAFRLKHYKNLVFPLLRSRTATHAPIVGLASPPVKACRLADSGSGLKGSNMHQIGSRRPKALTSSKTGIPITRRKKREKIRPFAKSPAPSKRKSL